MAQAEEARSRLCEAHGLSEAAIELVPVLASGDRVQDRPLAEIGGKALWTRELDQWLGERRIDAAVHSLKDVETIRPDSLALAAILPRADKRDMLLGAASLAALPQGATIGTSAPRRAAQALNARPDCRVVTFRGNVATRMAKLAAGDADATFLAAAGLSRLGARTIDRDRLARPRHSAPRRLWGSRLGERIIFQSRGSWARCQPSSRQSISIWLLQASKPRPFSPSLWAPSRAR